MHPIFLSYSFCSTIACESSSTTSLIDKLDFYTIDSD